MHITGADGDEVTLIATVEELALVSNSILNAAEFIRHDDEYHALIGFEKEEAQRVLRNLLDEEAAWGLRQVVVRDSSGRVLPAEELAEIAKNFREAPRRERTPPE